MWSSSCWCSVVRLAPSSSVNCATTIENYFEKLFVSLIDGKFSLLKEFFQTIFSHPPRSAFYVQCVLFCRSSLPSHSVCSVQSICCCSLFFQLIFFTLKKSFLVTFIQSLEKRGCDRLEVLAAPLSPERRRRIFCSAVSSWCS